MGFFWISSSHQWLEIPWFLGLNQFVGCFFCWEKILATLDFLAESQWNTEPKHIQNKCVFVWNPCKSACSHEALGLLLLYSVGSLVGVLFWAILPKLWLHQLFKIQLWHFTKWEACHMMRRYQLIHALPRMHKSINGWCVRSSRCFAKTVGHVQERTANGLVDWSSSIHWQNLSR